MTVYAIQYYPDKTLVFRDKEKAINFVINELQGSCLLSEEDPERTAMDFIEECEVIE